MKKLTFTLMIIFIAIIISFGQDVNLNQYKYVVVPTKYYRFNKPDIYGLSSLTRLLFFKKGITAIGENKQSWPKDLKDNLCLAVYCTYEDVSPLIGKNKMRLMLKDCDNNIVYNHTGRSNTEEGVEALQVALRKAFQPIADSHYTYNPDLNKKKIIHRDHKYRVVVIEDKKHIEKAQGVTAPSVDKTNIYKQVPIPVIAEEITTEQYTTINDTMVAKVNVVTEVITHPTKFSIFDPESEFKSYAETTQLETVEGIYKIKSKKGELTILVNKENNNFKITALNCTSGFYEKNSIIGLLKKSSLEDVFSITWLNPDKSTQHTVAYIDKDSNFVVDMKTPEGIKQKKFIRTFP